MPPFVKAEKCVSVYSGQTDHGRPNYRVTYIEAKDNIWDASDGGHFADRAENINADRIDVEIPQTTAHLIKQVWLKMLSGRQSPREWEVGPEFLYGDATTVEFSLRRSPQKALYGEAPLIMSDLGRKTKQFVGLGDALVSYTKAKESDRRAIAVKIEPAARKLLAQLD